MDVERRGNLIRLLKPGTGKVVIFVILVIILLLIPIYPVTSEKYTGPTYETTDTFIGSTTKVESFLSVVLNDFEWTVSEVDVPPWYFNNVQPVYYRYELSANPMFTLIYVPLTLMIYFFSCYYIELEKGKRQKTNI